LSIRSVFMPYAHLKQSPSSYELIIAGKIRCYTITRLSTATDIPLRLIKSDPLLLTKTDPPDV